MKKLVIAIALVALAGAGYLGLRDADIAGALFGASAGRAAVEKTVPVERRTIAVNVQAVGEINPANLVTVKSEVSGRVQTIHAGTGQQVKRGELLVSLEDTDVLTEQDAALTEIEGARLQLEKAERDFERTRELLAARLVSQESFDNAQTALQMARNEYERAGKKLQTVEDKLKKIRIRAPFDGTVLSVLVSSGQVVSGASGVTQGTDLMTFADLNEMIIRAHINQVDVTRITPGQTVRITVDPLPGVTLEGRVVLIAPIATVRNNIKGFNVDVLITKMDPRIRPGMNANLTFPVARVEDALTVPVSAVFTERDERFVYVKDGAAPQRRPVEIGVSDHRHTEILSGLRDGERVLLQRPASLSP
jgi:RND family efflux transporter MFP subunit